MQEQIGRGLVLPSKINFMNELTHNQIDLTLALFLWNLIESTYRFYPRHIVWEFG